MILVLAKLQVVDGVINVIGLDPGIHPRRRPIVKLLRVELTCMLQGILIVLSELELLVSGVND